MIKNKVSELDIKNDKLKDKVEIINDLYEQEYINCQSKQKTQQILYLNYLKLIYRCGKLQNKVAQNDIKILELQNALKYRDDQITQNEQRIQKNWKQIQNLKKIKQSKNIMSY
ncbi:unnamed protein product [Paramecium primaurelia]|uniref:Uncharacterized protein n=1 Tax=Paramecium primaurelia TaxID=5886 RepID=A0A8S1NWE5_PARPR|nr:unnamed protein product [Paramecium primaurelia]